MNQLVPFPPKDEQDNRQPLGAGFDQNPSSEARSGGTVHPVGQGFDLPPDVVAFEETLKQARDETQAIKREADGIIGPIGLDAFLTLIPVVGALYTLHTGGRLLGKASKVKAKLSTKVFLLVMMLADTAIGAIIGFGDVIDVLFRSHAMVANRIIAEAEVKLTTIAALRRQGEAKGFVTEDELARLRDTLFRGGRSETAEMIRLAVFGGAGLLVLYGIFF